MLAHTENLPWTLVKHWTQGQALVPTLPRVNGWISVPAHSTEHTTRNTEYAMHKNPFTPISRGASHATQIRNSPQHVQDAIHRADHTTHRTRATYNTPCNVHPSSPTHTHTNPASPHLAPSHPHHPYTPCLPRPPPRAGVGPVGILDAVFQGAMAGPT